MTLHQLQDCHTLVLVTLPMQTVGVSLSLPLLERHTWNVRAAPYWNLMSVNPSKGVKKHLSWRVQSECPDGLLQSEWFSWLCLKVSTRTSIPTRQKQSTEWEAPWGSWLPITSHCESAVYPKSSDLRFLQERNMSRHQPIAAGVRPSTINEQDLLGGSQSEGRAGLSSNGEPLWTMRLFPE